jgi:hypothetical protein
MQSLLRESPRKNTDDSAARRSVVGIKGHEVLFPLEARRLQEADAAVPAEDCVVISRGAYFFGFSEALKRSLKKRKKRVRRLAGGQLGFRAAFVENPGVVVALIGGGEFLESVLDFTMAVMDATVELVSDGEAEKAKRELLLGIDGEDIAANGFRLFGLVEVAIEFDFGEGFGDTGVGDGFEFVVHGNLHD